tara:strand:- start:4488 stop:4985 length:498 start_codon:yes stop_codon:yes gene_type:complete
MPNYTARDGLSIVVEKEKPKKTKGGNLQNKAIAQNDEYSENNPAESDQVYQVMKETGMNFDTIHKQMEKEAEESGGNLPNVFHNIQPKHLHKLKDIASHIWTINKEGFHKGALVDIVKAKSPKHLGDMVNKDADICKAEGQPVSGGSFHKTLKDLIKIASSIEKN